MSQMLRSVSFGCLYYAAFLSSRVACGATAVELEVVTEAGAPITAAHDWIDLLREVGFSSVRIRTAHAGDRTAIKRSGSVASPHYRVVGIVTRRNSLMLPGGTFSLREKESLRRWVEKLKRGGRGGPVRETRRVWTVGQGACTRR